MTAFFDLAQTSALLAATRSRLEKRRLLVSLLRAIPGEEIAAAVGWLVGEPLCGPIGVGPAQVWEMAPTAAAEAASLSLREVESALGELARVGHAERLARVALLFGELTAPERALFAGSLTGTLRQGSLGGVMLLAIAECAGCSEAEARRVVMLSGSLPAAADRLLGPGRGAFSPTAIDLFRPIVPMLAAPAESIEDAVEKLGDLQVEWKIDGVRAQVHKKGPRVAVYSRQGNDITEGCQPLLGTLALLRAESLVLDGEVVLVGPDGAPRSFQDSFSAIASKGVAATGDRLRVYFFDCLHRDGTDLLDAPLSTRIAALREVAPPELMVPAARVANVREARRVYAEALAAGNEGVVVKDLSTPYRFGARGRAWQKVKQVSSVDLVVLAAEWGSGRRKGFLSNLHLGARAADGSFCMIGKTFKGLTDAMLRWQTERLQELATERTSHVVHVRPELVVEIRFNDVQRSPRYPGGIALRFARVVRHREDKSPADVEPLASLVARAPKAAPKKRQLSLFGD